MTSNTGETKKPRDFRKEHARRIQAKKRYVFEMDRNQAALFTDYLNRNNTTFSHWVKNHIESDL